MRDARRRGGVGRRPGASRPAGVRRRRPGGRPPHGASPPTQLATALDAYASAEAAPRRRRLRRPPVDVRGRARGRRRPGPRPCGTGSATSSSTRPRTSTRCSSASSTLLDGGRGDLFLVGDPAQAIYGFNGADPGLLLDVAARFPGIEVVEPAGEPPLLAADRRRRRRGARRPTARRAPRDVGARPTARRCGCSAADDEDHEAALVAAFVRSLDPHDVRAGQVAVLARTNGQLPRLVRALDAAGIPVRRDAAAAGSPLAAAARAAASQTSASRLRGWAHDTIEAARGRGARRGRRSPSDASPRRCSSSSATSRSATAPRCGRGWRRRARSPMRTRPVGVDVLTFHAAKGREWPVVVVTGVETEPRPAPLGRRRTRRAPRRPGCCTSPSPDPPTAS